MSATPILSGQTPYGASYSSIEPLMNCERRANREVIDPQRDKQLALTNLQNLEDTVRWRGREIECASRTLCPVTCPIVTLGHLWVCIICIDMASKPLENRKDICWKVVNPCVGCTCLERALSNEGDRGGISFETIYAFPPEKQRMTTYRDQVETAEGLLVMGPYIEAVHMHKGIIDLTLAYLRNQ